jgi:putative cell wall-binding protein
VHFSFSTAGAEQRTSWWTMTPEDDTSDTAASVERIVGATRAEMAIAIADRAFPARGSAEQVYIADAGDPQAAMLASVLAGSSHGAVLLTRGGDRLEAPVDTELRRLLGDRARHEVVFVGDTDVFSPALVAAYRADYRVDRIAGVDAAAMARATAAVMEADGRQRTAVLVAADALDEALPMVAVAAANDWPVLFVDGDELDDDTRGFLVDAGIRQVHLAGTADAISTAVRRDVAALDGVTVDRQGRRDAVRTAVAVARTFFAIPSAYAVADGDDPALAAVAAAYAGERRHAPLLVTDGEVLDDVAVAYVERTTSPDTAGIIVGGRAQVTTAVERALREALR